MTTAYSNLLGLALPVTGELSGTWGDTVNDYITKYLDDAIANAQIISGSQTAVTLSKTTGSSLVSAGSGATGSAQYALIRCTGNPASTLTITVSYSSLTNAQFSKTYLIFNSTSTSQSVVVQATTSSGTSTGVTITSGEKALIAWNGTDFVKIATQSGTGEFVTVDTTNLEVTNIKAKDGTAAATIADSTGAITVSTILNVDNLRLDTNTISSTDTNGNIVLAPNGTGDVQLDADTVRVGDSNVNVTITSNGTADLILNTNAGTNSGSITIEDGANGNIIIAPNGTGQVQISNAALDLTTIEVTNIKAKDGTASMTLADSTGIITLSATAGTANGVAYLNGSRALTTGSALTFDGTNLVNTSSSVGTPEIAIANSATSAGANARLRIKTGGSGSTTYGDAFIQFTDSLNWNWSIGAGSSTSNNLTFNQYFGLTSNELMRLTSTGLKASIAGTNADPVFSYTSDTNTGIFFPAADKLGFTAGGGTNQMVLTSTGLGIGTNNPGAKLDVTGQIFGLSSFASYTPDGLFDANARPSKITTPGVGSPSVLFGYFDDGSGQYNPRIGFKNGTAATAAANSIGNDSSGNLVIGTGSTSSTTHVWLNQAGNLGLGVTPSASVGAKAMNIGSIGYVFGDGATYKYNAGITSNAYVNGNGTFAAIQSRAAGIFEIDDGVFKWKQASTGTANTTLSVTQAMTLDASGNLIVGATSATSGFRLDVVGGDFRVSDVASDDGVEIGWSAGGNQGFVQAYDRNASAFRNLNFNGAMTLDSSGNLGLGQVPAVRKFEINAIPASISQLNGIRMQMDGVATSASEFLLGTDSGGVPYASIRTGNDGNSYMNFLVGSGPTERMRISSDGTFRVKGAGTAGSTDAVQFSGSAPASAMTLDALGNLVVGGTSANVGTWNKAITLNTASGNASYELTVAGAAKGFFAADASNVYLQSSGAIPLIFTTNGGERARITSGGDFRFAWNNGSFAGFYFDSTYYQGLTNGTTNRELYIDSRSNDTRADIVFRTGLNTAVAERARITSGGDLLVGTQTSGGKLTVEQGNANANGAFITNQTYNYQTLGLHNTATANDNILVAFGTEAIYTTRGSIQYNRGAGLIAYLTTSDYRAKDISGPVVDSGALIDSVPVYMGKMKGATQERPMFIAHETPAYAHTGVKDAVDADGKPVYQQMDASALVPVMWAEIQSLRARVAQLEQGA